MKHRYIRVREATGGVGREEIVGGRWRGMWVGWWVLIALIGGGIVVSVIQAPFSAARASRG